MPAFTTEAIVLRGEDFGERDRLITFYTEDRGKLRGVAKGAKRSRKRFGANLELLAHVRIQAFERRVGGLVRVDGADLLEHFPKIREDLTTFARGCYVAEWVDGCTALHQALKGLFPLLLWVLRRLEAGTWGEDLLRIFEIRTLDLAGYRPQLSGCVTCGGGIPAGSTIAVDIAKGGLLCGGCSRGSGGEIEISSGTTRILEDARRSNLDRLHRLAFSSKAREEARAFLQAFYSYHVGRRLRSTSFLRTMERQTPHGERN